MSLLSTERSLKGLQASARMVKKRQDAEADEAMSGIDTEVLMVSYVKDNNKAGY